MEQMPNARALFLRHADEMLSEVMAHGGLLALVYYPKTRCYEVTHLPDDFTVVPLSGEAFPESLFPYLRLSPEHEGLFRRTAQAMNEGEPFAEFTFGQHIGGRRFWYSLRWTNYSDENGDPDHVLILGSNVTDAKKRELLFAEQMLLRENMQDKIPAASCFNVTQDTVVLLSGKVYDAFRETGVPCDETLRQEILESDPAAKAQRTETQDILIAAAAQIPDETERTGFIRFCSHASQFAAFDAGNLDETLEYRRLLHGKKRYVATRRVLVRHPQTQDLYAFFYTTDINEKKQNEQLIEAALHQSCDFIALIDIESGIIRFRLTSAVLRQTLPMIVDGISLDYSKLLNQAAEHFSPQPSAEMLEPFTLEYILAQLEKNETYVSSCELPCSGQIRHKQTLYRWLDDTNSAILCIQLDVTASREREQEKIRRDNKMLRQAVLASCDFIAMLDLDSDTATLQYGAWLPPGIPVPPDMPAMSERGTGSIIRAISSRNLADEETKIRFAQDMNPKNIRRTLERQPIMQLVYDYGIRPGIRRKLFHLSWFDREAGRVLMVKTDITGSYQKDQQIALDDLIIRKTALDLVEFIALLDPRTEEITVRAGSFEPREHALSPDAKRSLPYPQFLTVTGRFSTNAQHRKAFLKDASMEQIISRLMREREAILFVDLLDFNDETITRKKQLRYTWLDEKKERILVVGRDITKSEENKKRHTEQMQALIGSARKASRSMRDFYRNLSVSIRQPVNTIIESADSLIADPEIPEATRDNIKHMQNAGSRVVCLLDDLLALSQIEAGTMSLSIREFSLCECIHAMNVSMRPIFDEKQQQFDIYAADLPYEICFADDGKLRMILTRLLSNAAKFTDEGGCIALRIKGTPITGGPHGSISFEISDNGRGMSEAYQEKMFIPFCREERSDYPSADGAGLGLAITHSLVNLMGGTITVRSRPSEGAVFTVILPMRFGEADSAADKAIGNIGRILVVDDEQEVCENTAAHLRSCGARVEYARSGSAAIAMLKQAKERRDNFSLVLLDQGMPGISGIETAAKIRELFPKPNPTILLTAYDFSQIEDAAREAGVDDLLPKPFFPCSFRRMLKKREQL